MNEPKPKPRDIMSEQHKRDFELQAAINRGTLTDTPRVEWAVPYACTCRFVQKDEFSAGALLPESICGYHASKERELTQAQARCAEVERDAGRLRDALEDAADALYNDFEPDNQSRAYQAVIAALKETH